jgi:membrane protein required for colicin V production
MNLAGIDIVFAVVILIMALRSGFRGFIREFMSMAALILGIGVAVLFSGQASIIIDEYLDAQAWSQVIAFLALFVLVYLFVKIFESALNRLVERINLANLDHALGFFLGVAEGLFLVFLLLLMLQIQPFVDSDPLVRTSIFAEALLPFLPYASRFLGV